MDWTDIDTSFSDFAWPQSEPIASPVQEADDSGEVLLQHLRHVGVLHDMPDDVPALSDDFLRRTIHGARVVQNGTYQLDWPKIQRALAIVDPMAGSAKRKAQYQEILKPIRRREKTSLGTHNAACGMDSAIEQRFATMDQKLDQMLHNQKTLGAMIQALLDRNELPTYVAPVVEPYMEDNNTS